MFNGKILSGDWDKGWLEITGMPKNFVLSARRVVVMEESEYTELAEVRKKPEPFEQIKKLKRLIEKSTEGIKDFKAFASHMADIAIEADKVCLVASKLFSDKSDIQLRLNAKINSAHHEIARLNALLSEIVSANPECCWRKCWDCGRKQIHSSDVTPGVLCRFCGSQDTRLMKKETQALKGEKQCLD